MFFYYILLSFNPEYKDFMVYLFLMNTRNIVIIIITAIFAAIAFTLFQREPEVKKVITDSMDFSSDEEPENFRESSLAGTQIYSWSFL